MAYIYARLYSDLDPQIPDHLPLLPLKPDANQEFLQTPGDTISNLQDAQEKASRKRVVRKTALIAAGIFVCIFGMLFAFFSYICIFNKCQVSKSSVTTTAQLGPILTISQVTSHIAPLSVPFIMGILSNLASAKWLKSSVDGGPNRPSPMQLGLLMSMYDGAGLYSLFTAIKYIFKGPKSGQRIVQPPLFGQCVVFLGSLLTITYLAAAADSWLHASSMSVVVFSNFPYSSGAPADFGREINATMCAQLQGSDLDTATSCGLVISNAYGLAEGHRVVLNTSTLHHVVFTHDQIALVVPQSLPGNITYSARTLGVKSQCMSVTKECILRLSPESASGIESTVYGGPDGLNLNCTKGGIRFAEGATSITGLFALDNEAGYSTGGNSIDTNPFNTGDIMYTTSFLYAGVNNTDQFINNTGWFVHGIDGAYNIVYCNVTALSVAYRYESSRYITESSTPQPLDLARYMMSGGFLVAGATSVSLAAISHTGIQSIAAFEDIYSLELSRQLLAGAAYIYQPSTASQIQFENQVNGSELQLIPLVLFVAALLIFLCQVFYIATRTVVATWGVRYVALAARHLSSPIIAMQRLYGHPDPELTWGTGSESSFGPESECDRLHVGPVLLLNSDMPGSVFIVEKGHAQHYSGLHPPVPSYGPRPDHQPLLSSKINGNPEFFQTPVGTRSDLQDAQEKASRERVVRKTGLIAAGIFVCTFGMLFAFFSYICIFNKCQVSKSSVTTTAQLGPILTISQVTSHIAPLSVPFIMGILSNLASERWLMSSVNGGPNCPSPMQLGLLMSMYDGAGLYSLFTAIKYIFKGPKSGQKIVQPPLFGQCVVFLGSLLTIAYLAAAADSWLHASSMSVVVSFNSPYSSGAPADFGREINATMCLQAQEIDPIASMSCGLVDDTIGIGSDDGSHAQSLLAEGYRVVFNMSTLHHVVFSHDQIALVVPQSLPGSIGYLAQTLGVKSQCISVTKECILPPGSASYDFPTYGDSHALDLNCSRGGIGFADGITGLVGLTLLEINGTAALSTIDTNPFNTGDIMYAPSFLYPGLSNTDQFINNTGWFVHDGNGACNVVYCNVTALSVTYRYESSRYITESSTPQPLDITRYIMAGGVQVAGGTSVSSAAISRTGIQSLSTFEDIYSLELSRQLLAGAAYIYQPSTASQIQFENQVNGSELQLIPLVLFVAAILIFLCQVLYVATRTMVATWGVQYVGLAARHLSSPIITMQRLYGHPNLELTWEMDSDKGFGLETESDRLCVGPVASVDSDIPGSVFMVAKERSKPHSRVEVPPEEKLYQDLEPGIDDDSSLALEVVADVVQDGLSEEEGNSISVSGPGGAIYRAKVEETLLAEVDGYIIDAAGLFTQEEGSI